MDWSLTIVAVYCPPKHAVTTEQFRSFYTTLGQRFLVGGDYNTKHCHWSTRLITPKGRELLKDMKANNLSHISMGEPTYWPSDRRRVSVLIDFGIVKRISINNLHEESSFDLSSDHPPVIININWKIIPTFCSPTLNTKQTNWEKFTKHIRENLSLDVPFKTNKDKEDYVQQILQTIKQAAWNSIPNLHKSVNTDQCAPTIKQKILEKRKLRKRWQNTRSPQDKAKRKKTVIQLKQLLNDKNKRPSKPTWKAWQQQKPRNTRCGKPPKE